MPDEESEIAAAPEPSRVDETSRGAGELLDATQPIIDEDPIERPVTRSDCRRGIRPCPWVSCRHHLIDTSDEQGVLVVRGLKLRVGRGGALRPDPKGRKGGARLSLDADEQTVERFTDGIADALVELKETCALDVVERRDLRLNHDGHTLATVGDSMLVTRERIRQIERLATRNLRTAARKAGLR